jgi:hypothetical protein
MRCPSSDELAAMVDGEATEARARDLRRHVERCPRCAATASALEAIVGGLRAVDADALRGEAVDDYAARVVSAARTKRRAAPRYARVLAILAAAMVPFAAAYVVTREGARPEWTARGAGGADAPAKRVVLRFGRVPHGTFEPILPGGALHADDAIVAEVGNTARAPLFLLAFVVDAAGTTHWIYPAYDDPASMPTALPLPETTAPRVLDAMVRLDAPAHGPATLVAIVSGEPLPIAPIELAEPEQRSAAALRRRHPETLVLEMNIVFLEPLR